MLRRIALVALSASTFAFAEEKPATVEAGIPAPLAKLPAPAVAEFPGGLKLAVSTQQEEAQAHAVLGLDHLHGGWEFEAARHFAAALKADPDCLLAQWGLVMTMLTPTPENGATRNAAMDRLLDLVDAQTGSELERGYAYGLIQYFKEGPVAAAEAFRKLSAKFPNDTQAAIFNALFSRGGYDEFGDATPAQERSEKILTDLLEKSPDSTLLLYALLTIRAEAPDLSSWVESARKLCQLSPAYPPYWHLLGHYEWRTGHHAQAIEAFAKASSLYTAWMKANGVTAMDCPGWVMAEEYRAVALASQGNFDAALTAAKALAATPVPMDRAASPGGRMLLWEGETLPARLLMRRGQKGDAAKALAALPTAASIASYREKSLANYYVDGLRFYLDALRLVDEGKPEQAMVVAAVMAKHGERMATMQDASGIGGERSAWVRGFRALEVLASELRGRIALAGPKSGHGSAYNWFRSAVDRQTRASMLLPPAVLTPMNVRLGEFYLATAKPADAVEAYRSALKEFPNDKTVLKGLVAALKQAGLKGEAAEVAKQLAAP